MDIGAREIHAAVSPELDATKPVRSFNTFTDELKTLVAWFQTLGITTVAMEATSVYWISAHTKPFANRVKMALRMAAQTGARVAFLPAYSPDLNPIELMWSEAKGLLRAAQARTREESLVAIGKALAAVSPNNAQNWCAHCGYTFI